MFFPLLFLLTVILFRNAFSVYFFNDDFFFLKISRISGFGQFLGFFSPDKNYFYRPLSTETFYFFIHALQENVFLSHLVVFIIYFLGLLFLYKIIFLLSRNKFLSGLTVILYAINSSHVFQLYYFGTFQEVSSFAFLAISFLFFLEKKTFRSVLFFLLALLSKESSLLFIPFIILFYVSVRYIKAIRLKHKYVWQQLVPYFILGIVFLFLYRNGLASTSSLDSYRFRLNPRLAVNNFIWYFFWSLGAPNFTPLYFVSILKPPIAEFWKMLKNFPEIKIYFMLLIGYYGLFAAGIGCLFFSGKKFLFKLVYRYLLAGLICLAGFAIFIGPVFFIEHRWMVRLTVPLVFIIAIQSFFIIEFIKKNGWSRILGYLLIIIYLIISLIGTPVYESSSTFLLESRFTQSAKKYFEANRKAIIGHKTIYFIDRTKIVPMPWGGSEKLKVTLGDQNFTDHYFPGAGIKTIYGFENKTVPKNAYVINSFDILLPE